MSALAVAVLSLTYEHAQWRMWRDGAPADELVLRLGDTVRFDVTAPERLFRCRFEHPNGTEALGGVYTHTTVGSFAEVTRATPQLLALQCRFPPEHPVTQWLRFYDEL